MTVNEPKVIRSPMTINELIERMKQLNIGHHNDLEVLHYKMDELLLEYIGNKTVTNLYYKHRKLCA